MSSTIVVPGEIKALGLIDEWIDQLVGAWRIPLGTRFAIKLCCEESFTNIVLHGYKAQRPAEREDQMVRLALEHHDDQVQLTIEDHGAAFDPLKVAPPAPVKTIADSAIGGHGIQLMRRFTEQITYERRNSANLLSLRFTLAHKKTPAGETRSLPH
jgi:anti-sigma regulatory factor (Ser/Thr protein kinase)